jgi:glutamine amidotransferase
MDNKCIVIVDYKLGNLFSIEQACKKVGLNTIVTSEKKLISKANSIILPGVGAFGDAMTNLRKLDLISPLNDAVSANISIFGICLGMQLLFEESEEYGIHKGLGFLKGEVKRMPRLVNNYKLKVPNIGWNTIYQDSKNKWLDTPLFNIKQREFMYFVHSFYTMPDDHSDILTYTNYQEFVFCSSVKKNNICAFQFHPEKSGEKGLSIYYNIKNQIL